MSNGYQEIGLVRVWERALAYMQKDEGLGWSNAGIIRGKDGVLLIDTLFELHPRLFELLQVTLGLRPLPDQRPVGAAVKPELNQEEGPENGKQRQHHLAAGTAEALHQGRDVRVDLERALHRLRFRIPDGREGV